jgi:GMP synthase (glutamine-hydrolysing)
MSKIRENLKILYIQIRDDDATKIEELNEFVRFSGLGEHQFTILNVFDTPNFGLDKVNGHDAVFIGGSSDASVLKPEKYPFVENIFKLIRHCVSTNIPVLASCFGFQGAVIALGGKMIHDESNMEMGMYEISLTQAGREDPLFKGLPEKFMAVSGHKERAIEIPNEAINLAVSKLCPFHALKLKGKPFYAFQFHPEVDKKDMVGRIVRYKDRYLDSDGQLEKIIENSVETPIANELIRRFVDLII